MWKYAPYKLVLSYTRLMMGFLLFHPAPRDILIVGLGGGSLSKYCYRYLPEARITTVEISDKVIALRETFAIPADDERFRIVHADGADYIKRCFKDFDAILLDGFDVDGLPSQLSSQSFYRQCVSALRKNGVLVANLLEGDWTVAACVRRLRRVFNNQVVGARPERGFNLVLYALNQRKLPEPDVLQHRAMELETRHDLNFRSMVPKIQSDIRPCWTFF